VLELKFENFKGNLRRSCQEVRCFWVCFHGAYRRQLWCRNTCSYIYSRSVWHVYGCKKIKSWL